MLGLQVSGVVRPLIPRVSQAQTPGASRLQTGKAEGKAAPKLPFSHHKSDLIAYAGLEFRVFTFCFSRS